MTPETSPEHPGEDLAALLQRVLADADISQRELARRTDIPVATISAWMTRRRGHSGGIDSDTLHKLAAGLKGHTTAAEIFESTGREVPGELDQAREARLLKNYRSMTVEQQRWLLEQSDVLARMPQMPRAK